MSLSPGAGARRLPESLLLAALSTALLCAPVVFHRWIFRRREKERLARVAITMVLCGLGTVGLAISAAVLLVVSFVERGLFVPVVVALVVAAYAGLSFVLPLVNRSRHKP
jgi:ABC-type Fe3+ transport system permease subunit